jgi:hypothetical protein
MVGANVMTLLRIQLSRKEGWEKPPNTVVVTRPGKFGNEFRLGLHKITQPNGHERFATRAECVQAFLADAVVRPDFRDTIRTELRGKNLACWCKLCEKHVAAGGKPLGDQCERCETCHSDVLGVLANDELEARHG